jgi:hypothetical protein
MNKYEFYVDSENGQISEATPENIQDQKKQILVINGIEALTPPQIWVGDYNGEMIFYPSGFENIDGGKELFIFVGKTQIKEIKNTSFKTYEITVAKNGNIQQISTDSYHKAIKDLINL